MIEVFVDGASGTTGLEIVERLGKHPDFTPVVLDEAQRKDREARREALNDSDFAVLCLPDVAALRDPRAHVSPCRQNPQRHHMRFAMSARPWPCARGAQSACPKCG